MNQDLVNLRAFMNDDATFYPETTSELIKRVLIFRSSQFGSVDLALNKSVVWFTYCVIIEQ